MKHWAQRRLGGEGHCLLYGRGQTQALHLQGPRSLPIPTAISHLRHQRWCSASAAAVNKAAGPSADENIRPETGREGVTPESKKGFWNNQENQRLFLERLGKHLGLKKPTDWYSVSRKEVMGLGGSGLFTYYHSLFDALQTLYPEHPWDKALFRKPSAQEGKAEKKPNRYAQILEKALAAAEKKLEIKRPEDWYAVTLTTLRKAGFPTSATKLQLVQLLSQKYPEFQWEKMYILLGRFAHQKVMERAIEDLFPSYVRIINARKEANLVNPDTGSYFELDVYIPELKLGFEYQDIHHYTQTQQVYQPLALYKRRDELKKVVATEHGISLVVVPCWWDGCKESLVATLKLTRPELLPDIEGSRPIPESIPPQFFDAYKTVIPGIGEPTNACFLSRANTNPVKWWIFEKYDGVRGLWNPVKRLFYTRQGNVLNIPDTIIESMPSDFFLDGELWFGRGKFQEAVKLTERVSHSEIDWSEFKYMVFDIPVASFGTYAERYQKLEHFFGGKESEYVALAPKQVCKGSSHMDDVFAGVIESGGEGIILRDPASPYEPGRSRGFLKLKKFRDAEARIVGSVGPHQWECELPNGVKFVAVPGSTDFANRYSPNKGDIVSFKHRGFIYGTKKPKLPTLYRMRTDLTWDDVMLQWKDQTPRMAALSLRKKHKPRGFWLNIENRREWFCEYASEQGFHPFDPQSWAKVTKQDASKKQGGDSMMWNFKGSLKRTLRHTFPELNWGPTVPGEYFREAKYCREFFDSYAKTKGFDASKTDNWYEADFADMEADPTGKIIHKKNDGFEKALQIAYPELYFKKWRKVMKPKRDPSKWFDVALCRKFFDDCAAEQGFNPLKPENWYAINLEVMSSKKGGRALQALHGGFKRALKYAYPTLKFTRWPDL